MKTADLKPGSSRSSSQYSAYKLRFNQKSNYQKNLV